METNWILFDEAPGIYEMVFDISKGAKCFLVATGVKGGIEEKLIESFAAKGYCISGWGKC